MNTEKKDSRDDQEIAEHIAAHGPGTDDLDSLPPSDFISFTTDEVEEEGSA